MKRLRALILCLATLSLCCPKSNAVVPDPGGGGSLPWLDYWSFSTTTWWSDRLYAPISFTNLSSSSLGNGTAVVLDSTNVAWLRYKVIEADGTNNLKVDRGAVMFWFAPSWSGTNAGGSGPGQWGRLIEAGSYTTNASYGWWSLFTDPEGVNLYFSAQTNGAGATFLSAPIVWTTNYWHLIALNYSSSNSALYLDGMLVTNGAGVTIRPNPDVLTNGFTIGSDSNGVAQAHGMFDDLSTYAAPLDATNIAATFDYYSFAFYLNPENFANAVAAAPFTNDLASVFNVITGSGNLTPVSTNLTGCSQSSFVWITNVSATAAASGTMNMTFTIAGGLDGVGYDVFANSALSTASSTNAWAWMGQGIHCATYTLTNLPAHGAYLILGTPQDTDFDGLTDAYENLVSKTNPLIADSNADGIPEAWAVLNGLSPNFSGVASLDADGDGLSNLQEYLWGGNPQSAPTFQISVSIPKPFSNVP